MSFKNVLLKSSLKEEESEEMSHEWRNNNIRGVLASSNTLFFID